MNTTISTGFSRVHVWIAAGLLAVFMAFILFGGFLNWSGHHGDFSVMVLGALAVFTGPFDGSIARPGDGAAWIVVKAFGPGCGLALALAVVCQFIPLPFRRGAYGCRIGIWSVGVFVWLAGAVLSFLNAIG